MPWLAAAACCALIDGAALGTSPWDESGDATDPWRAVASTAAAADGPPDNPEDRFRVDLDFQFMYGQVDGFLQTGSGGEPGTTDPNRPTLDEIGIDFADIYDVGLALTFDQHIINFGAQIIRLDGSATLSQDLLSQSAFFPAGTSVDSSVKLDWYHLGYQYEFHFDLPSGDQFRFAPGVQAVLFDFHYQLDGSNGGVVDRSYAKGGFGIGATAQWQTTGPFSLEAGLFWGIPIENMVEIFTFQIIGRYQLWGRSPDHGGSAYLGLAFETLHYQDSQRIPNDINIDLGPLVVAGLQWRF